jgi:hypothetical protein
MLFKIDRALIPRGLKSSIKSECIMYDMFLNQEQNYTVLYFGSALKIIIFILPVADRPGFSEW